MSLINKMLRDLDARHASEGERSGIPAAVTPLSAHRGAEPRSTLLRGAVALALGLAAAAWYFTQVGKPEAPPPPVMSAPPAAPAATSAVAPAVSPSVAPSATPADAEPAAVAPASAPSPAPPPGGNTALPLLRMADQLSVTPAAAPRKPEPSKSSPPKSDPPKTEPARTSKTPEPAASAPPPRAPVVALPREPQMVAADARIEKQARPPPPAERAEQDYKRGVLAQRQGHLDEAAGRYRAALEEYPEHAAARQTLAALLIDAKRFDDAEEILRKGAELAPVRMASTLALARLKVERNQSPAALELLLKNAASGERSAEYQGFAAALLNRAGRAAEAVERYQAATRLAPNEGRWWAGLGIALESAGKPAEARDAYQKARSLPGLPADLAQHIEQRLH